MTSRATEIEVKLLLFAIQRTTTFENLLAQRFAYASQDVSLQEPFYQNKSKLQNKYKNSVLFNPLHFIIYLQMAEVKEPRTKVQTR